MCGSVGFASDHVLTLVSKSHIKTMHNMIHDFSGSSIFCIIFFIFISKHIDDDDVIFPRVCAKQNIFSYIWRTYFVGKGICGEQPHL